MRTTQAIAGAATSDRTTTTDEPLDGTRALAPRRTDSSDAKDSPPEPSTETPSSTVASINAARQKTIGRLRALYSSLQLDEFGLLVHDWDVIQSALNHKVFRSRAGDCQFVDRGERIESRKIDRETAFAMIELARARDWKSVTITGGTVRERTLLVRVALRSGLLVDSYDKEVVAALRQTANQQFAGRSRLQNFLSLKRRQARQTYNAVVADIALLENQITSGRPDLATRARISAVAAGVGVYLRHAGALPREAKELITGVERIVSTMPPQLGDCARTLKDAGKLWRRRLSVIDPDAQRSALRTTPLAPTAKVLS